MRKTLKKVQKTRKLLKEIPYGFFTFTESDINNLWTKNKKRSDLEQKRLLSNLQFARKDLYGGFSDDQLKSIGMYEVREHSGAIRGRGHVNFFELGPLRRNFVLKNRDLVVNVAFKIYSTLLRKVLTRKEFESIFQMSSLYYDGSSFDFIRNEYKK
jgi:hypothetical protein